MRHLSLLLPAAVSCALCGAAFAQVRALSPTAEAGVQSITVQPISEKTPTHWGDHDQPPPAVATAGGGCSSSQFEYPKPTIESIEGVPDVEERFSIDCGGGLDTGCTFRGGGPLIIQLPIRRYLGETNGDGTLAFPFTMNSNRLISINAKLRLPVFDVDYDANPPHGAPERDRVSINGHTLGFLTGANNIWKLNEFTIPITYLKFPSAPGSGGPPAPAMNEIRIDIDVANSEEFWCTAVDWVSVTIEAMAPIALHHGINADHTSWDPDVTDWLDDLMIVHSNNVEPIDNDDAGYVILNGQRIQTFYKTLTTEVGTRRLHVVAHSKGGLDNRGYLWAYYDPTDVKVLSLHTLSTPHHGSILADISIARMTYNDPTSSDERIRVYMNNDWLGGVIGVAPERPGLDELTQAASARRNAMYSLPGGIKYYCHSADADVNNNLDISNAEAAGMIPGAANGLLNTGTLLYHTLRFIDGITVTRMTNLWGLNEWHVISPILASDPNDNDMAVTQKSAQYPGFSYDGNHNLNHSTIKGPAAMAIVFNHIKADYPVKNTPN